MNPAPLINDRSSLMTEHQSNFKDGGSPSRQDDDVCKDILFSGSNDEQCFDAEAGCFTKDTIVSTSDGPFHLGDLRDFNKRLNIITHAGSVLTSGGVARGGVQDVFGLLTDSSYIKGTSVNRVLRIFGDSSSEMTALTDLRKGDLVLCQKGIPGSQVPVYNDELLDVSDAQDLGKHISNMSMDNIQGSGLYLSDKFHNKSGYFSINFIMCSKNLTRLFFVYQRKYCMRQKNMLLLI
ncbi:hypothetical protein GRU85_003842 [Salmonella enterica]|nr:hypothetical protein [Salmonella enterica]